MDEKLSSLEQARLTRRLARNAEDIKRLEQILKGVPLGTVRFANAIIDSAKIESLSADKITTGSISAGTKISVNNNQIVLTGEYFLIAKDGFDAETADPKDMVFDSRIPCLKFIENGKRSFTINNGVSTTYEQDIDITPFPLIPFVYLYNPDLDSYEEATPDVWPNYFGDFLHVSMEYSSTKLYVTVMNFTGSNKTTHYYWYLGYA